MVGFVCEGQIFVKIVNETSYKKIYAIATTLIFILIYSFFLIDETCSHRNNIKAGLDLYQRGPICFDLVYQSPL